MKKKTVRLIARAGAFTALIFVFTAYLHIPSHTGYTHVGDGFIYLAACVLPTPYAVIAGSAGAALADLLSGYAIWAPGTIIIKAISVLFFSRKGDRIVTPRNALMLLPASAICIGGYYLYEALITSNFTAPLAGIPGYVTQSVLSSALYLAAGLAMDKLHLKSKLEM